MIPLHRPGEAGAVLFYRRNADKPGKKPGKGLVSVLCLCYNNR